MLLFVITKDLNSYATYIVSREVVNFETGEM
jgi:hypothetical protein